MSRTFADPGQVAVALRTSRITNGPGCYAGGSVPVGYEGHPILEPAPVRPQPPRKPLSAVAVNAVGLGPSMKDGQCSRLLRVETRLIVGRLWLDMAGSAESVVRFEPSSDCVGACSQEETSGCQKATPPNDTVVANTSEAKDLSQAGADSRSQLSSAANRPIGRPGLGAAAPRSPLPISASWACNMPNMLSKNISRLVRLSI
jgi:hypothetical protein